MRQFLHCTFAITSTLVLVPALLCVLVSVLLAVLAYWVCRAPAYSNCWAWAASRCWTLTREWIAEGMPRGWEPRLLLRWSRNAPRWLLHVLVGVPVARGSDALRLESFKPAVPDDAPGWRAVTHALFLGRAQSGDGYESKPMKD